MFNKIYGIMIGVILSWVLLLGSTLASAAPKGWYVSESPTGNGMLGALHGNDPADLSKVKNVFENFNSKGQYVMRTCIAGTRRNFCEFTAGYSPQAVLQCPPDNREECIRRQMKLNGQFIIYRSFKMSFSPKFGGLKSLPTICKDLQDIFVKRSTVTFTLTPESELEVPEDKLARLFHVEDAPPMGLAESLRRVGDEDAECEDWEAR